MDSGKEYITEKDESVAQFIDRCTPKQAFGVNYISLDKEEKIFINGSHVSSIEVIEDDIEVDEDDELVMY